MSDVLKGMLTEEELLKIMGLKPSELAGLRHNKGLPYVRLTVRRRVYLEDDLMEWFKGKKVVSDPSEMPKKPPHSDTQERSKAPAAGAAERRKAIRR